MNDNNGPIKISKRDYQAIGGQDLTPGDLSRLSLPIFNPKRLVWGSFIDVKTPGDWNIVLLGGPANFDMFRERKLQIEAHYGIDTRKTGFRWQGFRVEAQPDSIQKGEVLESYVVTQKTKGRSMMSIVAQLKRQGYRVEAFMENGAYAGFTVSKLPFVTGVLAVKKAAEALLQGLSDNGGMQRDIVKQYQKAVDFAWNEASYIEGVTQIKWSQI